MTQNPNPELPFDSDAETDAEVTRFQPEGRHGLITGTGLGKYRILERLRNTHNAIIYKARDAMLDRLVSLKQLSPGLIDDPVACGEFKREAQLLARLSGRSRNVTHVYELIGDENGFFIAEEYIEGDWMETQISKRIFTLADAAQILRHGCLALGALQIERIVHRDAWPGNWLVGANGRLILTNFSTATREGDAVLPPLVHAKYSAPEILLGEPCDCRSDIYTFGMILYEICVGRSTLKHWCEQELGSAKPHEAEWRAWHVDLAKSLPPACELNSDVNEPLSQLIRQMTAKEIDDRAGSYQEILRTVNRELAGNRAAPKAIGDDSTPKILEIRRVGTDPSGISDSSRHASLTRLLREDQSTTTTQIAADAARRPAIRSRRVPTRQPMPVVSAEDRPRTVVSQRISRDASESARKRLPKTPIVPPAPTNIDEPKHVRPGFVLTAIVAIALTATLSFVGYHSYVAVKIPDQEFQGVAAIIQSADQARSNGDFATAREKLDEALVLTEADASLLDLHELARSTLLLVEAGEAVESDDFADAESALSLAEKSGAASHVIHEIRDKLISRRDAYRIRALSEDQLAKNQFDQVELELTDYRKIAGEAGLDPDELDRKLSETRDGSEYAAAVRATVSAIESKDFETALVKARDARNLRDTPEARRLVDRIIEAKRQHDHRLRGDRALRDGDFGEAEAQYKSALENLPDDEIEKKLRTATAARLFVEADNALKSGDLLSCQRLLRNSIWQVRSNEAISMLERLTPAFEAANMVKNAERALESGDAPKAILLLETAIPHLPSPARERALEQLAKLKT